MKILFLLIITLLMCLYVSTATTNLSSQETKKIMNAMFFTRNLLRAIEDVMNLCFMENPELLEIFTIIPGNKVTDMLNHDLINIIIPRAAIILSTYIEQSGEEKTNELLPHIKNLFNIVGTHVEMLQDITDPLSNILSQALQMSSEEIQNMTTFIEKATTQNSP